MLSKSKWHVHSIYCHTNVNFFLFRVPVNTSILLRLSTSFLISSCHSCSFLSSVSLACLEFVHFHNVFLFVFFFNLKYLLFWKNPPPNNPTLGILFTSYNFQHPFSCPYFHKKSKINLPQKKQNYLWNISKYFKHQSILIIKTKQKNNNKNTYISVSLGVFKTSVSNTIIIHPKHISWRSEK